MWMREEKINKPDGQVLLVSPYDLISCYVVISCGTYPYICRGSEIPIPMYTVIKIEIKTRQTRDTDLTWKPLREKTTDARRRNFTMMEKYYKHETTDSL